MKHYDVIVIGGGASGMMAAGRAAAQGKKVLVLEKNKALGTKLAISGGGRCNITNAEKDLNTLLKWYGSSEQYLYSSFSLFSHTDTFSFFEALGLPLVVQAKNRAFPHTEQAEDVRNALTRYMHKGNVEVLTSAPVKNIGVATNTITHVQTTTESYTASSYILATGGLSHPETGSTGDGFGWLKKAGHTIVTPSPSLVPLVIKEEWVKALSGTTGENLKIAFYVDGVKKIVKKGNILFTHFGMSGPLILNVACEVGDLMHTGIVSASIDLFPDKNIAELDTHVLNIFEMHKNKTIKNVFGYIVGPGMTSLLSLCSFIDPETKVHSVGKEQRKKMLHALKSLTCTVEGLMGYDKAIIADGGVPLKEIDMKTMRSNILRNLFITGDLLHIHRPSGGFSLQLCWTTGYVAGSNA